MYWPHSWCLIRAVSIVKNVAHTWKMITHCTAVSVADNVNDMCEVRTWW
jgi:hypothetical protein